MAEFTKGEQIRQWLIDHECGIDFRDKVQVRRTIQASKPEWEDFYRLLNFDNSKLYKCPKHNVKLHTVEGYLGALIHDGCPEIFTVIDDNLCILGGQFGGNKWHDVKTGEVREVSNEARTGM